MAVSIAGLTDELVALVKQVPSVSTRSYSVFNVEEIEHKAGFIGYPLAGISYEGCTPIEHNIQPKAKAHKSVSLVTAHFLITVGVNYNYATDADTKPIATDLLDEVRAVVLGYIGVNSRPWRYTGEIPLPSEIEGAILYGQMWETDIPVIGNSPN